MPLKLSDLARLGFTELEASLALLERVAPGDSAAEFASDFRVAASPDRALRFIVELRQRAASELSMVWSNETARSALLRVLGASEGLGDFVLRHPATLLESHWHQELSLPTELEMQTVLGQATSIDELRVAYRSALIRIAAWDLSQEALAAQSAVSRSLADLAAATLDAGLTLARAEAARLHGDTDVDSLRFAVIGMGKTGARELNYVSDVDVLYVAEPADAAATTIAQSLWRVVSGPSVEPPLWELDTALRPEGKDGALVRTLESHFQYYQRWAKEWEFQALIKARPIAGDMELGAQWRAAIDPLVWSSSNREGFVTSVQRMRERVIEHIPADEVYRQLKLGPGGLRDIEFTVQLLQLVHGRIDERVRQSDTLGALQALTEAGYVGRVESAQLDADYRFLRVLEHRLQLSALRRTHLMPDDEPSLRLLARSSGLATGAQDLLDSWSQIRARVRGLHQKLFYRPLLAAVSEIPIDGFNLSNDRAAERLAAIGFRDPTSALLHLAALTSGVSRRAVIHQALLPVMLAWLAEGADPDHGLLVYRRLSEQLGETHWYLGMLRDSNLSAQRMAKLLSSSRFVADVLELIPESVAWLDNDGDLVPRTLYELREETTALLTRHVDVQDAAVRLRSLRRRETLRVAMATVLGICDTRTQGIALTAIAENHLKAVVELARRTDSTLEFAVIAMGRFGGRELGFGSDLDVLYVYRDQGEATGSRNPATLVGRIQELADDPRLPFELDANLRPEGRSGDLVRSLDAYRAYYQRWSLTWEAQALLRARAVAGDSALGEAFEQMADLTRYPQQMDDGAVREIRRIKARVENERLPQGADPARHLKLGRGSISDVEWLVQLLQLQCSMTVPQLRTTSTLEALDGLEEEKILSSTDAEILRSAWLLASQLRSSSVLWTGRRADVLPTDRTDLDAMARLQGFKAGSASELEEMYLSATRRARAVFERLFYG